MGEPARYFYGVANKVHLEALRPRPIPELPPPTDEPKEVEREFECLDRCMQHLTEENRALVLDYYQDDKQAKIEIEKTLRNGWELPSMLCESGPIAFVLHCRNALRDA